MRALKTPNDVSPHNKTGNWFVVDCIFELGDHSGKFGSVRPSDQLGEHLPAQVPDLHALRFVMTTEHAFYVSDSLAA